MASTVKKVFSLFSAVIILFGICPSASADTGAPVKRAAFLETAASLGEVSPRMYDNSFKDVSASDSFSDLLCGALYRGVVSEEELFRPDEFITREEAVGMVVRALKSAYVKLDTSSCFFPEMRTVSPIERRSVEVAYLNGILDEERFYPKRAATEDFCAELLQRALYLKENLPLSLGCDKDEDINFVRNALREKPDEKAQALFDEAMERFYMNNSQSEVLRGYELIGMAKGLIQNRRTSFLTGEYWYDDNSELIQAHGGGILYDEKSATYYWYGEARNASVMPENLRRYAEWGWRVGVSCYSSKDLYNWKCESLALEMLEGDDLSYPQSDIRVGEVLERPKVIYNEKTDKYVMWMHIDNGSYGYSRAGVAVSDSPTGPFTYLGSFRPCGKMSRDMTIFKDDDNQAYLYFSTDENGCLACVKLADDYLSCTNELDYCIWWKWREAPAVFKYDNTYYMITSGCTGWDANAADFATAPTPQGPWTQRGNPCVGSGAEKTFGSQSAWVLPIDSKAGKFIFIGDIWRPSNHSESGYVWLPIQINSDGSLRIEWLDEWRLSDLGFNIDTKILDVTLPYGEEVKLPKSCSVTLGSGKKLTPVAWQNDKFTADMPGHFTIYGTLPEMNNSPVCAEIFAMPENLIYFVSCGGSEEGDFAEIKKKGINNSVPDKSFGRDSVTGLSWGYVSDRLSGTREDENMYYSVRYDDGGEGDVGTSLSYMFEVENDKKYDVAVGIFDPWGADGRVMNVSVGDFSCEVDTFAAPAALRVTNVSPEDGFITVKSERLSPEEKLDPIISWISISPGDGGESAFSGVPEYEEAQGDEISGFFKIANAETGRVLSIANGEPSLKKPDGSKGEFWFFRRERDGTYTVKNALDGRSPIDGETRFTVVKDRGVCSISPKKSGGLLAEDFGKIVVSDDLFGFCTRWILSDCELPENDAPSSGIYRTIRSVKTGRAISYAPGETPLGCYSYDGSDSQKWSFKKTLYGSYIISAKTEKVSLDVPNGRGDDGLEMVVYMTIENVNQRWFPEKDENGSYLLKSEASGLYLTAENGRLVQRPFDKSADQSFKITIR